MFDFDDELVYEPKQTAAIVMTGGDEEEEAAAREVWGVYRDCEGIVHRTCLGKGTAWHLGWAHHVHCIPIGMS